jgi:lipopolysaccharide/colanic/teichoic acid biosynthesis glycosyltransferase
MLQVGFNAKYPLAYRAFNIVMALLLIVFAMPLLLIVALLLLFTQGRDVIYYGPRLGERQRIFYILKFRTLCSKRASAVTRDCPLPRGARIETPLGGVLRDSRLDELPQLFNILKGDMNICGPRPVRPEIAAIERKRIRDYDLRFKVKPGLIGPTQAYFGHGTSKRIRARMNNRLVVRPVSIAAELALLGRIGFSVLARIGGEMLRSVPRAEGASPPARRTGIWLEDERGNWLCAVEAITSATIRARGLTRQAGEDTAVLHVRLRSGAVRKARIRISQSGEFGMLSYSPETEFGEFIIERYALKLVVLAPKLEAGTVARQGDARPEPSLRLSRS